MSDNPQKTPVPPTGPRATPPKPPVRGQFFRNLLTGLFILLLIASIYSIIAENRTHYEQISLSQLATDVSAGKVKQIIVNGDTLQIYYNATARRQKNPKK